MTTPNYDDILEALQRAEELQILEAQADRPPWLKRTCEREREARLLRQAKSIIEAFREIEEECSDEIHCFNYEEAEVCQCGGFRADGSFNDPYCYEGIDCSMKPTGDTV